MPKYNGVMIAQLEQKTIVVTGGSGLIGQAILESLIKKGAQVINLDIKPTKDTSIDYFECDICNDESVKIAIEYVVQKYGKIDGLVNNAYPRTDDWGTPFHSLSKESWRSNIDWQLNSHIFITKYVIEHMKGMHDGSIVFMASIYGMVGNDFSLYEGTTINTAPPYSAVKGALISFCKYLTAAYGKHNVRVNCISPGGVYDNQDPAFVEKYEKRVPLKRMASPEDIAPSVSFLLSDDAKYITGHNLVVDGGWTSV
jgi:NAD(P)-dependent dehydrogenase (short-subunit alcohol dehydrogenase family)